MPPAQRRRGGGGGSATGAGAARRPVRRRGLFLAFLPRVSDLPSCATILISQPVSDGSALMRLMSAAPREVAANSCSSATTGGFSRVIASSALSASASENASGLREAVLFQRWKMFGSSDEDRLGHWVVSLSQNALAHSHAASREPMTASERLCAPRSKRQRIEV